MKDRHCLLNLDEIMRTLLESFVNMLLPRTCLACHALLCSAEKHLCTYCLATLPSPQLEVPSRKALLMDKFHGLVPFVNAFSLYCFSNGGRVHHLLHSLKYSYQREALLYFGRHLGDVLCEGRYGVPIDLIIPVPLHPVRYSARGYNQSHRLAEGVSQCLERPVLGGALMRTLNTRTQTIRGREERWENVGRAFVLSDAFAGYVKDKDVLLVDDLVTTGATLTACAECLLKASVASLSFATLAVALQD